MLGSSNSYKPNQTRGNDWRVHASMVDRDMHSNRLPTRRERKILSESKVTEQPLVLMSFVVRSLEDCSTILATPEWADDNFDDDTDLGAATFENDGTFTRIATTQKSITEKQSKPTSKSASDSAPAQIITVSR